MTQLALSIGIPLLLVVGGYLIGRSRERAHFQDLDRREQRLQHLVLHDLDDLEDRDDVAAAVLVFGEAVIASDYYKSFAASLRGIIGGEVKSLGTTMTRARREALVRMLEDAQARGAQGVINVRLQTSEIGNRRAPFTEILAYGTAVTLAGA